MAKTKTQRVQEQRQARIFAGWSEVRVWAVTPSDADKIREYAATLRAETTANQVRALPGVPTMNDKNRERALAAINSQGSAEFTTPSGPIMELLSDFAKEGALDDFAIAFQMFIKAHPSNQAFVTSWVPGKILNYYLLPLLGLNNVAVFENWKRDLPDDQEWFKPIVDALTTPQFAATVKQTLHQIQQHAQRAASPA
ncbi:hypothetical protein [Achromobacter xylosoxidans]|uniref:hypothetical protein n=1 Tax=Alcaligenes xylosoxydans xylosoxydans TaxID=85698 RepID=UPI001F1370CF|nr:hypothetical protein [Achromobacter xylosoxidans]